LAVSLSPACASENARPRRAAHSIQEARIRWFGRNAQNPWWPQDRSRALRAARRARAASMPAAPSVPAAGTRGRWHRGLRLPSNCQLASSLGTLRSGESAFECGPDGALRVHRVVDHRHHAEEAVNHSGVFLVLHSPAGTAQCLGLAFAVIVQHVAFSGDDDRRGDLGKARSFDRRGPPIICILRAAQIVIAEPNHRVSRQ